MDSHNVQKSIPPDLTTMITDNNDQFHASHLRVIFLQDLANKGLRLAMQHPMVEGNTLNHF